MGNRGKLRIRGVRVRDVTATSGSAEVRYDLPGSVVGNDNWVEFTVHDGRGLVSDCHAPIGGESTTSKKATIGSQP